MTFSDKLRRLRKEKKLTQIFMAKELGISARAYQNYEEGRTYPKDSSLYRQIANYFQVSVEYLMDDRIGSADELTPGVRDRMQALIDATEALYAGGTMTKEDEDAYYAHMAKIYERARRRRAASMMQ